MANFTDDFTGTSGDNLEDRTGWSLTDGPAGAAEINASNQLKYSTTSSAGYQAPAASNSNHFAQAVRRYEPVGSTWFFPWCICFADSSNFIGLRFIDAAGDKQEVWKAIGGSFTKLASASDGGGAGTLYKIERSDTAVEVYKGGLLVGSLSSVVGASELLNNNPGMRIRNKVHNPVIDDWESPQAAVGVTIPIFDHHNRMMRSS